MGTLRTLQHRIKTLRATEGPAQEVYFVQEHRAGELCESDFTNLTELGITIAGEPFAHMLYHFVLTYSNWETGTICQSESFASLSEGLQNALWELGGAQQMPRTDCMRWAGRAHILLLDLNHGPELTTCKGDLVDWQSKTEERIQQ